MHSWLLKQINLPGKEVNNEVNMQYHGNLSSFLCSSRKISGASPFRLSIADQTYIPRFLHLFDEKLH